MNTTERAMTNLQKALDRMNMVEDSFDIVTAVGMARAYIEAAMRDLQLLQVQEEALRNSVRALADFAKAGER